MKITTEDADRLGEIVEELSGLMEEFKRICRGAMTPAEYQLFKYRTLGHVEPGITENSDWVNQGELDTLEAIAEEAKEDAIGETELCDECKKPLCQRGYCRNEDCSRSCSEED